MLWLTLGSRAQVLKNVRSQSSSIEVKVSPSAKRPRSNGPRAGRYQVAKNDEGEHGKEAILKLVESLDSHIPEPVRDLDKPFLMPIEDIFSIQGRIQIGREG